MTTRGREGRHRRGGRQPHEGVGPQLPAQGRDPELHGRLPGTIDPVHVHGFSDIEFDAGVQHQVELVAEPEARPPLEQVLRDHAEAGAAGGQGIDHDAHRSTVSERLRRHRGPCPFCRHGDGAGQQAEASPNVHLI